MASKTVKRWITINGNHVPVYEDGSLGGFMEGEQKYTVGGRDKYTKEEQDEVRQAEDKRRAEASDKAQKELDDVSNKLDKMYGKGKDDKKIDTDEGSFEAELEERSDPNYKNVTEGVKTEKQLEKKEPSTSFGKDFQDKADTYRDKFLKNKSDEEIAEIKKNLDTSTNIVGTTENDHVAYKAIEDEMASRKSTSNKGSSKPSLEDIKGYGYDPADVTGDPTIVKVDGDDYYKVGNNKWKKHSSSGRVLSDSISDQQLSERLENASDVKVLPSAKSNATSTKGSDSGSKESYHVEHIDSVGGKFVDGGKVGDYEIGEKVNYISSGKTRSGTITKAHIYPNGRVDYNVVDSDGDGHNVSTKNLIKQETSSTKSIKIGDKEVGVSKTKPTSSKSYDEANAEYKKSEARSQKIELTRAKESGDYSSISASTYLKMSISEIRSIGRQLGLSDFALSGNKSEIIADILRIKRKK